jgi:hypothetical protein
VNAAGTAGTLAVDVGAPGAGAISGTADSSSTVADSGIAGLLLPNLIAMSHLPIAIRARCSSGCPMRLRAASSVCAGAASMVSDAVAKGIGSLSTGSDIAAVAIGSASLGVAIGSLSTGTQASGTAGSASRGGTV